MADEAKKGQKEEQSEEKNEGNESKEVKLTPDLVKEYLDSEEGKSILQPRLDKHFTKGLETWKEKTLPDVLEKEIEKRFPKETEEQKELRKLKDRVEKAERERSLEAARNKALSYANEKGIPASLVDYVVEPDEDKTLDNVKSLTEIWSKSLKQAVEGKFKKNGRNVDNAEPEPSSLDEQIKAAESSGDHKKALSLKNQKLMKMFIK